MKRLLQSHIVSTGLAIFSMLFGAGNLMYPLKVGMDSGSQTILAMTAFLTTAVLLPIIGLVAMMLYDGDYDTFFNRLGSRIGSLSIFACMLIIGPGLVIPRITTLSHTMLAPYLDYINLGYISTTTSFIFALFFLGLTFILSYQENRIVDILGTVISPLLLASLTVIIVKSFFGAKQLSIHNESAATLIKTNLLRGYGTLDLLGAIFFAAIIFNILKSTLGKRFEESHTFRMNIGLKAGTLGVTLLGIVYCGMGYLGAFYGYGLGALNEGELFREISSRVLGQYGALIIAIAVLMACLSTSIALSAVLAEYAQKIISRDTLSYLSSLILVLLLSIPLSVAGLGTVLAITAGPLVYIGYPALITLTLCNIGYKLWDFTWVKLPVTLTFVIALITYIW